jgi:hypothetical protein
MKQALFTLSVLLVLGACDNTVGETQTTPTTVTTTSTTTVVPEIVLAIAGPNTVVAGTTFDLNLSVTGPTGANITSEATYEVVLENTDGATIDGTTLTLNEAGVNTVTVTASWKNYVDEETATIEIIDSNGPLITVTSPTRGEYLPAGTVAVSGYASDAGTSIDTLSVNGTVVTVSEDGSFSSTISPTIGANILTVEANDTAGNSADYISGFMVGDYAPDGSDIDNAIELRLDESGIGFLAEDALASFDMSTLESELYGMNPLYYSYSSTDWYCWYNEIIEFDFTGLSYGDMDVILDPKTGYLRVGITITNLQLDFDGYIEECYVSDEFSATISSSLVTVTVDNYFTVDAAGNITVTGNNPIVTLDNYDLTLHDSWIGDIASLFGYDLESMIYDEIVGTLTSLIVDEVPPAIEDALSGIAIDTEFDMVGASVGLTAQVSNIIVDEDGLTVTMAADADGGFVVADIPSNPGSVLFLGAAPTYGVTAEMGLGMNLDLLNQVLHESWQVGALSIDILNDEIGIEPALLGLIFEGATTLDIEAYPMLPPVLTSTGSTPPLLLDINELQLDMYGTVGGTYTFLGTVAANINTELEVSLDSGMLLLTLGTTTAVADNINPTAVTVSAHETLETTLEVLLPSLLPSVLEDFALELPEIAGITMTLNSVDVAGEWIVIEGEID